MGRSTAPIAEVNLKAMLVARAELDGACIELGLPVEEPPQPDRIYLASVDDLTRTPEARGVHRERYTLNLLIEVRRPGAARETVRTRMWDIVEVIEDTLAVDDELALNGIVISAEVTGIPSAFTAAAATNDGWIGKANVKISVESLVELDG